MPGEIRAGHRNFLHPGFPPTRNHAVGAPRFTRLGACPRRCGKLRPRLKREPKISDGIAAGRISVYCDAAHESGRVPEGRLKMAQHLSQNHAVGGAPPSRRLTAWTIHEGDFQATVFDHCAVNLLRHGNGTQRPRSDGLSRRDGGASAAWLWSTRERQVPEGRQNPGAHVSFVPPGLSSFAAFNPALKCWAIFLPPSGWTLHRR